MFTVNAFSCELMQLLVLVGGETDDTGDWHVCNGDCVSLSLPCSRKGISHEQ